MLSSFAYLVDPQIVRLDNLGYDDWTAVAFQRSSVIVSELVLAGALLKSVSPCEILSCNCTNTSSSPDRLASCVCRFARGSVKPDYPTAFLIAASVLLHPGLIMVDHIHFQYNGMLLGILLWSLVAAREVSRSEGWLQVAWLIEADIVGFTPSSQGNLYACAALFATLLNFKHIFVYLALPFVVFLFRRHCFTSTGKLATLAPSSTAAQTNIRLLRDRFPVGFKFDRLVELGLIVASICALSFGPFVLTGGFAQLPQIVSRLFPFQRGLNHAYWAGNVWALVGATDRVLVKCERTFLYSAI